VSLYVCVRVCVCVCVEPLAEADKSDQWLGVSVSSQGTQDGRALVATQYQHALHSPAP